MKAQSIYSTLRGGSKPGEGLVINVRGPIGSGKSTLCRGLEGRHPWRFWYLDVDAALSGHPPDLRGDYIRQETPSEIDILGLHAKMILGRGLNLLLDQNFQTRVQVDRFLRHLGRGQQDPRIVLIRLTVETEEAVRRKTNVRPSYIRASHEGFHLHPILGELVVRTNGETASQVLRQVRVALRSRYGPLGARGHVGRSPM